MNTNRIEKIAGVLTIILAVYLLCFGAAQALFPIRPFWNDEWRLLYNIKFKDVHQLWGRLDLLQQCPRVYLTILKGIISSFDYSYTAIRMPAYVVTIANVLMCFHLRKKLMAGAGIYGHLFVLIILSSQTFTDYMVQIKHYEMDIFLSLVTLWQLNTLLEIKERKSVAGKGVYLLLCMSFLLAPFFSYIYPILVAPLFIVVFFIALPLFRRSSGAGSMRLLILLGVPLAIAMISNVAFYLADVKQLMADTSMYRSYLRMLGNEKGESRFISDLWNLFALVGSGFIFEIIFGLLGITALGMGIYRLLKRDKDIRVAGGDIVLYIVILLCVTLILLLTGRMPGGVARITAFTVPGIALLITALLQTIRDNYGYAKTAHIVAGILFLGLTGNIISTCINTFTRGDYHDRITTYRNIGGAIEEARKNKVPVLYTDGLRAQGTPAGGAIPGKIEANTITAEQIAGADTLCAEVVLKVHPAYKLSDTVVAYHIPDTKWINEYLRQLPAQYPSAVVCDGMHYYVAKRP